jgi:hypothetical protein
MGLFAVKLILGFLVIFAWNLIWNRIRVVAFWGHKNVAIRWQLLVMALSDLEWLITGILIFVASDQLAWFGALTGPQALLDPSGQVPTFVLWLLDPTLSGMLSLFVAGTLFGFVTGSFGFSILLSISLLFPDLIAAPMSVVLVFGELNGASFRRHWRSEKHAAALRIFIAVICFATFWACGPGLRDLLQGLALNPMQVNDRLSESLILIFGLCTLDTFLAMVSFHFFFHWTRID